MIPASWLPDPYVLMLTGFGVLTALVVWLPLALRKLPLSLPIVCITLGAALFVSAVFRPRGRRRPTA